MELIKVKGTNNDKSIKENDEKEQLKVVAYIRVSTDFEEQEHSYEAQEKYYMNKINDVPNWIFTGIYGDEGISGTKVDKRKGFMKMIRDANNGKIDLILTKSISRFARNTADTLKYVRLLKEKNVGILFEEEHIDTLKISGEFLITVLSSIAQQESYNLSAHVQLGLKMKMMRGENVGYYGCFGYKIIPEDKTLEIVPKQAEIVKTIFNMYLKGHGIAAIKYYLESNNVRTYTNKTEWSEHTIRNMLQNEKYVGDLVLGKNVNKRSIAKIRDDNLYYIKDHHPAIIDRETFEKINKILKVNHVHFNKNPHHRTIFSNTFKCGFCGKPVIKRSRGPSDKHTKYYCKSVIRGNWTNCLESNYIEIDLIKDCFLKAMRKLNNKFKHNSVPKLEDYEHNYVYKTLCEYDNYKTFNEEFYKKIIKYVVIGERINDIAYPYNIKFVIKLEEDLFNHVQGLNEKELFNIETKEVLRFENKNSFKYFKYDKKGIRHLTLIDNHMVSVVFERNIWK